MKFFFILCLVTFGFSASMLSSYTVGGYFENWAQYRTGYEGKYKCFPFNHKNTSTDNTLFSRHYLSLANQSG